MSNPVYLRKDNPQVRILQHVNPSEIYWVMLFTSTDRNDIYRGELFVADGYRSMMSQCGLGVRVPSSGKVREVYVVPEGSTIDGVVENRKYTVIPNGVERKILKHRGMK